MRTAWILGALVVGACSSDIQYVDDDDSGVSGSAGTHSLDAASEWGTGGGAGGTSPADSGTDVVEDVTTDGPAPCGNVVHFDLPASADTQLDLQAASCGTNCDASSNWGHDMNLVVGLGSCPGGSTHVLVRFDIDAPLKAAILGSRIETMDLVLTTDPKFTVNNIAGTLNVFGMTSTWEEGTGLERDGANWCYATVNCCTQHTGSNCCQYGQKWGLAGALGINDSGPQAGFLPITTFDQDTLSVTVDPATIVKWANTELSFMLRSDGALKLYLKSRDAGYGPRLQGTYCDIDGSN
ncbi:MAG: hypothetical protein H6717_31745 [Polyangiaceae bacterium]|nr:hypothetical protein [Polyangiaceae bacterium]